MLAIGSRDLAARPSRRPESPVREALGREYNRLLQATITPGIVDTQCGAKAASRRSGRRILPECRETGYAWDAEAIAVARARAIPVREVPIEWRHDDRSRVNVVPRRHRDGRGDRPDLAQRPAGQAEPSGPGPRSGDEGLRRDQRECSAQSDLDHWWFRSKSAFVATAIRRAAPPRLQPGWLVDGGAGAGGVSVQLGWDPGRLAVVEGNRALVHQAGIVCTASPAAGQRRPAAVRRRRHRRRLPARRPRAHPRPDAGAPRSAAGAEPRGRLVINVPAHPWLWSAADDSLGHRGATPAPHAPRRARRRRLRAADHDPRLQLAGAPVWLTRRSTTTSGPSSASTRPPR